MADDEDDDDLEEAGAAAGEEAIELYERAIAARERAHGKVHPSVSEACRRLGYRYLNLGDTDGARRAAERAFAADPSTDARLLQADVLRMSGDLAGALEIYKKAKKSEDHALEALRGMGMVYHQQGNAKKARKSFEEALELAEEDSFLAGQITVGIGQIASMEGEHEEARGHLARALEILVATAGEKHVETAVCLNNLGMAWVNDDEPLEGAAAFQYALAIGEHVYPDDHPYQATTLSNLAYCASETGHHAQAIAYGERAMAMQLKRRGPDDVDVAIAISNVCHYYKDLGKPDGAAPLLARIAEHADALAATDRIDAANVLFSTGTLTLELLHDASGAARFYTKALRQRERLLGIEDVVVLNTARNAGAHLFEAGGRAEAESLLKEAIARWKAAEEHDDDAIETLQAQLEGVCAGDRDAVLEGSELEEDDEEEEDGEEE
jgi:tetratricopeptide (TPR) repeat protein